MSLTHDVTSVNRENDNDEFTQFVVFLSHFSSLFLSLTRSLAVSFSLHHSIPAQYTYIHMCIIFQFSSRIRNINASMMGVEFVFKQSNSFNISLFISTYILRF